MSNYWRNLITLCVWRGEEKEILPFCLCGSHLFSKKVFPQELFLPPRLIHAKKLFVLNTAIKKLEL